MQDYDPGDILECETSDNCEMRCTLCIAQVPTVVVNYQVPWRGWNHIDHLSSIDIDKYQNNYLLNLLEMYSNE